MYANTAKIANCLLAIRWSSACAVIRLFVATSSKISSYGVISNRLLFLQKKLI